MRVNRRDAPVPHLLAFAVAEKQPAFQKVFVIRIDLSAHVAAGVRPLTSFDVDIRTDQPDRRSTLVGFYQSTLRLFVIHRFAGEFAQRAKLDKQRSRLSGIRYWLASFPGFEIYVFVRQAGR